MSSPSARRWPAVAVLVTLAASAVFGTLLLFQQRERRGQGGVGSIFRGDKHGDRALFLLLRSQGLRVAPLTRNPSSGLPDGLLVIVNPSDEFEEREAKAIANWVSRGNALLCACVRNGHLPKAFGLDIRAGDQGDLAIARAAAAPYDKVAPALATASDGSITGTLTPLYRQGRATMAADVVHGSGRAVFVADLFSSSNAGLDAADNVFFYLEAARRLAGDRGVWFLETHHGFRREPSVVEFFNRIGLGPALLQLLLLALVAGWAWGARPAPILAPSTLVRRPAAEYATTMAHLYRRGRAQRHAASVVTQELQHWQESPALRATLRRASAPDAIERELAGLIFIGKNLAGRNPSLPESQRWMARVASFRRKVSDGRNR